MNFVTIKNNQIVAITRNTDLDSKWRQQKEAEGYSFKEIPEELVEAHNQSLGLDENGNIVQDITKQAELDIKERIRDLKKQREIDLPTLEQFLIAYRDEKLGNTTRMDAIINEIDVALVKTPLDPEE